MTEARPVPASARYKELTATATEAAKRMQRYERDKVARLEEQVTEGEQRVEAAREEEEGVIEAVRRRWDAAMEALFNERWMRVTPMPGPDPDAPATGSGEQVRAVHLAHLALQDALGRSRWSAAGWLSKGRPSRQQG